MAQASVAQFEKRIVPVRCPECGRTEFDLYLGVQYIGTAPTRQEGEARVDAAAYRQLAHQRGDEVR